MNTSYKIYNIYINIIENCTFSICLTNYSKFLKQKYPLAQLYYNCVFLTIFRFKYDFFFVK